MSKPTIFVGSSSEGLDTAREIAVHLQEDGDVTVWNDGVFTLGSSFLESLIAALDRFDFAVVVMTPDDLTTSRNIERFSARDNVLFELGLFMGRLGRSRTFIVFNSDTGIRIPSDLSGITAATYRNRADANLRAALSPACHLIRTAMRDLGPSEGKGMKRLNQATAHAEELFVTVSKLVTLLARSRAVELDVIASQFGPFIKPEFLKKMREDLEDLEVSTSESVKRENNLHLYGFSVVPYTLNHTST